MTMNGRRSRTTHAFTMIELMLVISIMMIVGLLAALGISEVIDHARVTDTVSTIRLMEVALEQFKADMGHYPEATRGSGETTETFINALVDPLSSYGWKRASLAVWFPKRPHLEDGAGNPRIPYAWDLDIQYCRNNEYDIASGWAVERTPGNKDYYNSNTFQLYSLGPNMKTWLNSLEGGHNRLCGTERDDIRNWTQETFYATRPAVYQ